MSHGDTVNIKLSMLIIFPQTELLANLAVFNLLELAGGADIAEYKCRRKHSGLPSKHEGLYACCCLSLSTKLLGKNWERERERGRDVRSDISAKRGLIISMRALWSKLSSYPALDYWNTQTIGTDESEEQNSTSFFVQANYCAHWSGEISIKQINIWSQNVYMLILYLYLKDILYKTDQQPFR